MMQNLAAAPFTDNYLLYLLARASDVASREFHAEIRGRGLTVPYWRVLATLSDGGDMTIGMLAERVLYQQPTLTKIVGRMEKAGFVRRERGTEDRRQVSVRITEAGQRSAAPLLIAAKLHESRILSAIQGPDRDSIKRVLRALIARDAQSRE